MATVNFLKVLKCLYVLLRTTTIPKKDWFLLSKSIFKTIIKYPDSVFFRNPSSSKTHFLTDFLLREIIVKSPSGLLFVARPKYEDLARFLFSEIVAKWEPISKINIHEKNIILDIGANVGFYSIKLSSLVGNSGKIISFEPDPHSFSTLKRNCELNKLKNVEIYNIAISEKEGILKLFSSEKHSGVTSLFNSNGQSNYFEVTTDSLDNILKNRFPKIDFIKIDTEGAELSILKGAENTLKITKKILIELHEEILKNNNQNPFEIEKILRDNGFKIKTFSEYWNPNESSNKLFKSDYLLGEK